jgi:hypothetical protein
MARPAARLRASRRNIPTHAIVGVSRLSPQQMRG